MKRGQTDDELWLERLLSVFTSETDRTGEKHARTEWYPAPLTNASNSSLEHGRRLRALCWPENDLIRANRGASNGGQRRLVDAFGALAHLSDGKLALSQVNVILAGSQPR